MLSHSGYRKDGFYFYVTWPREILQTASLVPLKKNARFIKVLALSLEIQNSETMGKGKHGGAKTYRTEKIGGGGKCGLKYKIPLVTVYLKTNT